jgi:hypothetical protein
MHLSNFSVIAWVVLVFIASCSFAEGDVSLSALGDNWEWSSVISETFQGNIPSATRSIYASVSQPHKIPTVLENGRILVPTVESYDVYMTGVSACSLIARNNIVQLLTAMGITLPPVAQGDAHDLIRSGRSNNILQSFTDKKILLDTLNVRRDEHVETVFDVYRFVAHRPYDLQAHRVAVFLGEDEEWYILDTLDGKKTRKPQLFREYLDADVDAEWLVRIPGYSMMDPISIEELQAVLPYFSPELQLFFQTQYFDFPQVSINSEYTVRST